MILFKPIYKIRYWNLGLVELIHGRLYGTFRSRPVISNVHDEVVSGNYLETIRAFGSNKLTSGVGNLPISFGLYTFDMRLREVIMHGVRYIFP